MRIELTPEIEKWLSAKVESGAIASADEFVNAALTRDFLEEQVQDAIGEPASPLTPEDWSAARERLRDRLSRQNEGH